MSDDDLLPLSAFNAARFWATAFEDLREREAVDETAVLQAAWRITRCAALERGLLEPEQGLDVLTAVQATAIGLVEDGGARSRLPQQVRDALLDTPLLPIALHPLKDAGALEAFELVCRAIVEDRRMRWASQRLDRALDFLVPPAGTLDPEGWPTLNDLVEFEESLIQIIVDRLAETSIGKIKAWLREDDSMRIPRSLVDGIVRLAISRLGRSLRADLEERRALMVSRLEGVAVRASEALNLSVEVQALRLMATVEGLTIGGGGGTAEEFIETVQRIAHASSGGPGRSSPKSRLHAVVQEDALDALKPALLADPESDHEQS